MKYLCCFLLTCLTVQSIHAQVKKSVEALNIDTPLNIDGMLDEPCYGLVQPASGFVQILPYNGQPSYQPTEVYFFYDQTAVYVGAMLFDSSPDSIFNYLTARDAIGMADYFGVYLDPYNQGQLAYGFFITPAGVQTDIKASKSSGGDSEDGSWDAVWESKTVISEKGWTAELRIPYSALRFPEDGGGAWGLNIFRNIRRYNSNNSWNLVDVKMSGFIHQEGLLTGITNIKPPVRLSVSPFGAVYAEYRSNQSSPKYMFKGGMDLKYGISESFTLDMMLIPDFGQIQSDDQQLNLSPYEIHYDEKRQFFNEGTELFERAGLFYSRRIGAKPKFSYKASEELSDNEKVDYNPTETQLLNATKVSGRTAGGWGLGLLNAMTLPSHATLKDTLTGEERKVLVQPFTNYNVMVVDKSLKNNSYISLINSNILMANNPFLANVTATDFQIRNKAKTYAIKGKAGISTRGERDRETGFYVEMGLDKNSGNLQFGISQSVNSDKFNINDLGYMQRNNEMNTEAYVYFQRMEPFSVFRQFYSVLFWNHARRFSPNVLYSNQAGSDIYFMLRNNYQLELYGSLTGGSFDYYEPRVKNRYFYEPYRLNYNIWASSDARKPIRMTANYGAFAFPGAGRKGRAGNVGLTLRIGRKAQVSYSLGIDKEFNDRGYVDKTNGSDTIYFARRDVKTIENVLNASYAINNKASLSMRLRHYWSGAANRQFYTLQEDGSLLEDYTFSENKDENYNAMNVDFFFRWIFAPGSELSFSWKNSILDWCDKVNDHYWDNLSCTWKSDQTNTLSLKVLYYIDYNNLRKGSKQ